tara:strand:- start:25 stop:210 length:186 start_codon:yes stop_codon:yes gene_type:complete
MDNPFQIAKAVERGVRPEIPVWCPPELSKLMEECWEREPTARPVAGTIYRSSFCGIEVGEI